MTNNKRTFEQAITELESIVEKLEAADVPLDQAIAYYQKGMELSKWCSDKLTDVEKQVANIVDKNGSVEPFEVEED
ncbi:exodeoxyribonuclease VII small subunit [Amphibacillus sediminis]|uniref:exodeoxyribonuclease VII small subunit n=1 Tax=Amphibacillus sediminis TaxID=360185 RepID=UPI00082B67E3|nr:exodeoxyribonuclease VII small subunit [Amphibacillus sediminis]